MAIKKTLLMGYTTKCLIDDIHLFLTSYSLTINTNVIKSNAVNKLVSSVTSSNISSCNFYQHYFYRVGLNAIRDCPTYEISLSFQLTPCVFKHLLTHLCDYYFHKPLKIVLQDQTSGFDGTNNIFSFNKCFVTNFSFSVDNDSVATGSLSATYYGEQFEYYSNSLNVSSAQSWTEKESKYGGGNLLMPYYGWGVDYNNEQISDASLNNFSLNRNLFNGENVQSFSFNFQHSLTPKYFCCASTDRTTSVAPKKIIFSLPQMNYDISYIIQDKTIKNTTHYSSCFANEIVAKDALEWNLSIAYQGKFSNNLSTGSKGQAIKNNENNSEFNKIGLKCQYCYPDSYTPSFGNNGSVNSLNVSGTIYGKIFKCI